MTNQYIRVEADGTYERIDFPTDGMTRSKMVRELGSDDFEITLIPGEGLEMIFTSADHDSLQDRNVMVDYLNMDWIKDGLPIVGRILLTGEIDGYTGEFTSVPADYELPTHNTATVE